MWTRLIYFPLYSSHAHAPTALTDGATLRGSYNFYHLANDAVTEYLRNYNLTTLPYQYYTGWEMEWVGTETAFS